MLEIGDSWDNGIVRIQRYADSIRCTDVGQAGKRGKRCPELAMWDLDRVHVDVDMLVGGLITLALMFGDGKQDVFEFMELAAHAHGVPASSMRIEQLRCVDVEPGRLRLETPYISVDAGINDVSVYDKEDEYNLPAAMTDKRTDAKKAETWVKRNVSRLNDMRFREVVRAIREETGVRMHTWSRMD